MTVSRRRFLENATALGVTGVAASAGALSLLPASNANAQAANGYEVLATPMNTIFLVWLPALLCVRAGN